MSPDVWAEEGTWVGKVVVVKKAGVKITYTDESGRDRDDFTLNQVCYTADQERGLSIMVRDHGVCGWIAKSDAVLLEEAETYFSDRVRDNPTDASAYGRRACAREEQGDLKLALEDFGKAVGLAPESNWWRTRQGMVWFKLNEYDKAVADFTEAIRLDPKNSTGFFDRGAASLAKSDYDRAARTLTRQFVSTLRTPKI